MVGYPNGMWDAKNNLPIFRRGITATDPKIDFQEKKEFMIDAAVFPGSSGSPVFIANSMGYSSRGNFYLAGRIILLGIVQSVFIKTLIGEVRTIPIGEISLKSYTDIPLGLGLVIKSQRILDFKIYLPPSAR